MRENLVKSVNLAADLQPPPRMSKSPSPTFQDYNFDDSDDAFATTTENQEQKNLELHEIREIIEQSTDILPILYPEKYSRVKVHFRLDFKENGGLKNFALKASDFATGHSSRSSIKIDHRENCSRPKSPSQSPNSANPLTCCCFHIARSSTSSIGPPSNISSETNLPDSGILR